MADRGNRGGSGQNRGTGGRGRGGRGASDQHRGEGRGGRGRGRGQQQEQSFPSRKQIESDQKAFREQQSKQIEDQIINQEEEKRSSIQGINKSYTLVKNEQLNTLEKLPDLSPKWAENIGNFLPYLPQNNEDEPSESSTKGLSLTDETIEVLNVDLSRLLKAKYNHFWSQVIYDPSFVQFLDTYLRYRKRPYEIPANKKISSHQEQLYKRVFRVILRISQPKETQTEFIDKDVWSNLIYEKALFDIPKIMDICVLYGACNTDLVRKMVLTIFDAQPKYVHDLSEIAPSLVSVILERAQHIKNAAFLQEIEEIELRTYFLDIFATLSAFFVIYPEGSHYFQVQNFIANMPFIYDSVMAKLNVKKKHQDEHQISAMHHQIELCKRAVLSASNAMLQHAYFSIVLTPIHLPSGCSLCRSFKRDKVAEDLMNILNGYVTVQEPGFDPLFLRDFGKKYSLQVRLHQVKQVSDEVHIDLAQIDYIQKVLKEVVGPFEAPKIQAQQKGPQQVTPQTSAIISADSSKRSSLITQVKEMIPDLGEGFIEACLDAMNDNPERVINALFENNLPGELGKLDRNMARKTTPTITQNTSTAVNDRRSLLTTRHNVYDYDEFDIINVKNIDTANVRLKSAINEKAEVKSVLSDRTEVAFLKKKLEEYEYEDEYDDSYDAFSGNWKISQELTIDEEVELVKAPSEDKSENIDLKEEEDEEEEEAEEDESYSASEGAKSVAPAGGGFIRGRGANIVSARGRGGHKTTSTAHKAKSHHRKERSQRKRGGFIPNS